MQNSILKLFKNFLKQKLSKLAVMTFYICHNTDCLETIKDFQVFISKTGMRTDS